MRNLTVALVVVIGILGGFYSGWKYSQSKVSAGTGTNITAAAALPGPAASGATSTGTGGQGGFGGRGTAGQVTAVNGSLVTIHNPQTGQDTRVKLGADTTVTKTVSGSAADIQPGVSVTVVGQPGADGTVNATNVIIGQVGFGGPGRATPTPGT
jgi:hypothetical protein